MDKTNYVGYVQAGDRICLIVEEIIDGQMTLVTHGRQGDTTFVGYTVLGGATFLIVDKSKGTGRKTQIVESIGINAQKIHYLGLYKGPPKA